MDFLNLTKLYYFLCSCVIFAGLLLQSIIFSICSVSGLSLKSAGDEFSNELLVFHIVSF